jgi:hypothetical protein
MVGWDGRHPQVDLFIAHLELDAAILRQAFFRDRHRAAHHLEPGDHRRQEFFRVGIHLDEFAIEAVADAHRGLQRLDVDVRSPQAEGFRQGLHHQADDRRVIAGITGFPIASGDGEAIQGSAGRRHCGLIKLAQVVVDVLLGGAHEIQLTADDVRQGVEGSKSSGSAMAMVRDRPSSCTGITL